MKAYVRAWEMNDPKALRVYGQTGRYLDLPEEVVERFTGRETELQALVDASTDFLNSEDMEIPAGVVAVSSLIAQRKAANAAKGAPDPNVTIAVENARAILEQAERSGRRISERKAAKLAAKNLELILGRHVSPDAVRMRLKRK